LLWHIKRGSEKSTKEWDSATLKGIFGQPVQRVRVHTLHTPRSPPPSVGSATYRRNGLSAAQSFKNSDILIHLGNCSFGSPATNRTELNPIAKNRDSLPTNGDSPQLLLVASEHQMLYNNCEHKLIYNNVSSLISSPPPPPISAEILKAIASRR
jgi:hypothetical protein